MSFKKLNSPKTKMFNFFTSSLENSKQLEHLNNLPKDKNFRVLIARPNHRLGNQLLLTPLLKEVKKEFPNCKIHLLVNGNLSLILFSKLRYVEKIINFPKKPFSNIFRYLGNVIRLITNRYDVAIAACHHSNSSKIFVKLSRAKYKIYNAGVSANNMPKHIAKAPVFALKKVLYPFKDLNNYKYSKLAIKLTDEEVAKGHGIVKNSCRNKNKTICIFTFATGKKCHSKEWWLAFYEQLKIEFPDFNILEILPIENVSQIDFESEHFYSNDLREIASVIENSAIFIGADSGMMHLSACTKTTTLGLFNNVKNIDVYKPYGGKNDAVDTTTIQISNLIEKIKYILTPNEYNLGYLSN